MEFTFNGEPITSSDLVSKMVEDLANDWPRPIPVSERLPEVGQDVLAFGRSVNLWSSPGTVSNNERKWFSAGWDGEVWEVNYAESLQLTDVAHWLPLPPSPSPSDATQS